jgi:hypothetical protein
VEAKHAVAKEDIAPGARTAKAGVFAGGQVRPGQPMARTKKIFVGGLPPSITDGRDL